MMKKFLLLLLALWSSPSWATDRPWFVNDDQLVFSFPGFANAVTLGGSGISTTGGITTTTGGLLGGPVNVGDAVAPVDTSLQVRRSGVTLGTSSTTGSALNIVSAVTPNADGLTDYRSVRQSLTISGANSAANATGINNTITMAHTAGTLAAATALAITGTVSGSGGTTTRLRTIEVSLRLGGDHTLTTADGIYARVQKTAGTTGTIGTSRAFHADDGGGTHVVTEALGVDVENFTSITGGGIVAAYRSKMASGTARWGFYSSGTALNAMAGGLRVGSVVAPTATLDVTGNIAASTTIVAGTTLTAGTTIATAAPAGSTAGLWKLGALTTAAVVPDTTRYINVDVGGVVYKFVIGQ
jgi:hypothetical protein